MPKVENDATKYAAKPFLIVAGRRVGGTYLAHALSSHPDVFCDRGEPLHHRSLWRGAQGAHLPIPLILATLTAQQGYLASGCKLVYSQAFSKHAWPWIVTHKPRIIWLRRDNVLRQGISMAINELVRNGRVPFQPVHSFTETQPPQYEVKPEYLLQRVARVVRDDKNATQRLEKWGKLLTLTYTDVVGGEGKTSRCVEKDTGKQLCEFLGIPSRQLCARLKRVHSYPLRAMFTNWNEIEAAIKASPYAQWLEQELKWHEVKGKWQTL